MIEINPIFDASTFWAWAQKHDGRVTEVTFDVVAPNGLFNTNSSLRDELRGTREKTGAEEVVIGLKSSEGLATDSDPIRDAVEYTEKSGGRIRGKAKDGDRFSSTSRPKSTTIDGDRSDSEPLIVRAARSVNRILGHRE